MRSVPVDIAELSAAVGAAALERGRAYAEQGRVLELGVEHGPGLTTLTAVTAGSSAASYRQEIRIETRGRDSVAIDGECSCPVGYNCKHVAAVCLAWLAGQPGAASADTRRHPVPDNGVFLHWLDALARAGSTPPPAPGGERIVWILDARALPTGLARFEIEAREVKPRAERGGYTRGRKLDIQTLSLPRVASPVVTTADRHIAALLLASGDYWRGPQIAGVAGYHAMLALRDSGRCHWQSPEQAALVAGPPRRLDLAWRAQEDSDTLRLALTVQGGGLPLATEPPLYVDTGTAQVGELDCQGLASSQLELLGQAPLVPTEHAAALAQLFATRHPGLPLPSPAPVAMLECSGFVPLAILEIGGGDLSAGPWVALDFSYDGERIQALPALPASVLDTPAGLLRIHRDLAAEALCHARLRDGGLLAVPGASCMEAATRATYRMPPNDDAVQWASAWSAFLHHTVPALRAAGWQVDIREDFALSFAPATVHAELGDDAAGNDWFTLGFRLEVDGRELPLLDLLTPILDSDWRALPETVSVAIERHRYVDVPAARLRPLLALLHALFTAGAAPTADGALRLPRHEAGVLQDLEQQGIALSGGARWRELAARLGGTLAIADVPPDSGLTAELRPYQQHGLNWLQFLTEQGFNGILADDMGLGKTVQTLAHLLCEKRAGRLRHPVLLVAPTSLMGNWQREAARFAPGLTVHVLHGQARHARYEEAAHAELVLTTYPLLVRDVEKLRTMRFHSVILDEAQTIKNPRSRAARVVRELDCAHRLCLTGTPLENHLGELWALFDFLMPGFLGDAETFRRAFRTPIEQQHDGARQAALARRIAPFMLRRTKQEVAAELPPKTEIVQPVEFGPAQAELYESIRVSVDQRVRDAIARQGFARSRITILDALLKLRQVCCDPRLLALDPLHGSAESAKFSLLFELLDDLLAEGRRVLLFSQFTSMLALIAAELDHRGTAYATLTGQTRDRDGAVQRFRSGAVPLFLISLKAGGVGLNLPEADTVIHYDPWWNPAAEAQATDRAHRIGQTQPVFVYKLIVGNSVEEKMLELQEKKRALAAGLYAETTDDAEPLLDQAALAALLAPLDSD